MHDKSADYLAPTSEACAYTHHGPRTYARWREQGLGPAYIRVGRKIRYRKRDIDAWLAKHRVVPVREGL